MEREESSDFPRSGGTLPILERRAEAIHMNGGVELDYWEVDPGWDGEIFRSALQAQRPNGSAELTRELKIKTGRNVCVRLITVEGELIQRELGV